MAATCVFWSGGKDCFLALRLCQRNFSSSDIVFTTFVPPERVFKCHPLAILRRQSQVLGFDHHFIEIDLKRTEGSQWIGKYIAAIERLRNDFDVDSIVTGDIFNHPAQIANYWLQNALDQLGLPLICPLNYLLPEEMFTMRSEMGIVAITTCVQHSFYRPGILGHEMNLNLLHRHGLLEKEVIQLQFDHSGIPLGVRHDYFEPCGEWGEYHTLVMHEGSSVFCDIDAGRLSEKRCGGLVALDWPIELLKLDE